MEWVVFCNGKTSLKNIGHALRVNALADHVLVRRRARVVRIYHWGGYEEYPIKNVVVLNEETYYVVEEKPIKKEV